MYQINTQHQPKTVDDIFNQHSNLFRIFGGPCSIESKEQLQTFSQKLSTQHMHVLRGGTYKARTKPDSFQGLGSDAVKLMTEAKFNLGVPIVSEVLSIKQLYDHIDELDIVQVGTRNMYNYELLKEIGLSKKPVILKRGFSATIEEFLAATSYISSNGNEDIILCERGIRTFETSTRNTLDLSAIPIIKSRVPYPIIVDPSHGTGRRDLIAPMAKAALACGADGLMIEVHPQPDDALSDSQQTISVESFNSLIDELATLAPFFGKHL